MADPDVGLAVDDMQGVAVQTGCGDFSTGLEEADGDVAVSEPGAKLPVGYIPPSEPLIPPADGRAGAGAVELVADQVHGVTSAVDIARAPQSHLRSLPPQGAL